MMEQELQEEIRTLQRKIEKLEEESKKAREYEKLLTKIKYQGGTHNFQEEIARALEKYSGTGLSQTEEY